MVGLKKGLLIRRGRLGSKKWKEEKTEIIYIEEDYKNYKYYNNVLVEIYCIQIIFETLR